MSQNAHSTHFMDAVVKKSSISCATNSMFHSILQITMDSCIVIVDMANGLVLSFWKFIANHLLFDKNRPHIVHAGTFDSGINIDVNIWLYGSWTLLTVLLFTFWFCRATVSSCWIFVNNGFLHLLRDIYNYNLIFKKKTTENPMEYNWIINFIVFDSAGICIIWTICTLFLFCDYS